MGLHRKKFSSFDQVDCEVVMFEVEKNYSRICPTRSLEFDSSLQIIRHYKILSFFYHYLNS